MNLSPCHVFDKLTDLLVAAGNFPPEKSSDVTDEEMQKTPSAAPEVCS